MSADAVQSWKLCQLPMADFIFGSTPGMQEARERLEAALEDDLPVLIEGESGTGKEVAARHLHLRSERSAGPFVRVNCGAIPARLLDEEIFGRGTYAKSDRHGAVKSGAVGLAAGGTLFLDEIADMDMALQHRVLRELRAQGSARPDNRLNARVVCASSVDLKTAVQGGRASRRVVDEFVHRVRLLPLRERKEDMPRLCEYLVEKFARNFGRPTPRLSPYVLDLLEQWDWPGNIRELENWIARIVIFGTEEAIGLDFRRQMGRGEEAQRRHPFRVNLSHIRHSRRQS
jgi:DNA-binding NtrC family response regulator